MKPLFRNRAVLSFVSLCLLFSCLICNLHAQAAGGDPTAVKTPESKMQLPIVADEPLFKSSAVILLVVGLLATGGGTALWIVGANNKGDYETALATWNRTQSDSDASARDAAGLKFFAPLISGIGLTVGGIILTIAGLSEGTGVYGYKQIVPAQHAADGTISAPGLYAFANAGSIGIAVK